MIGAAHGEHPGIHTNVRWQDAAQLQLLHNPIYTRLMLLL
jgi:hypothetical protein